MAEDGRRPNPGVVRIWENGFGYRIRIPLAEGAPVPEGIVAPGRTVAMEAFLVRIRAFLRGCGIEPDARASLIVPARGTGVHAILYAGRRVVCRAFDPEDGGACTAHYSPPAPAAHPGAPGCG